MYKPLLVLLGLAVAGCAGPTDVEVEQDFTLAPGKSAAVEGTGIVVSFEEVRSDTRCPIDAVCVDVGDAIVVLKLNNPTRRADVHTGDDPRGVFVGTIEIRLVALAPEPELGKRLDKDDYRATLRAIRHNSVPN